MHCTCRTLLGSVFSAAPLTRASIPPPQFLLPAFAAAQTSSFSTTAARDARQRNRSHPKPYPRKTKDGNPARGVSALHRTGVRNLGDNFEVKVEDLPKPVLDQSKRTQIETDEDHGLWDFFPEDRSAMPTPGELAEHGVAWDIAQLRYKDWHDLHRLWWVCLKELNRMNTANAERERIKNLYGDAEEGERRRIITKTMKAIKHTLTERWYAWDNARYAAMEDEEINMYANLDAGEKAYLPKKDAFEPEQEQQDESGQGLPPPVAGEGAQLAAAEPRAQPAPEARV